MARRTSQLFSVLGDDAGLDVIIELLKGERSVGALAAATALPQPTVSRRVAELREARLVVDSPRRSPIALRRASELRALLTAASALVTSVAEGDLADEVAFRKVLDDSGP